ncbi:DUF4232 domain-containing protein [Glutamicibacter sp. PS]|uniref:DUF4232 domain-containing protein n=1 Tax=Glutamicibacter sp. PS TaxID=3075634 RepID=UPI0028434DAA|nr:DUF4232 domain-containing protein [Glutamicibacter sp. PS]MDR4532655.1 DUF4232 domain-containing protein [Glutamicibacter sp. PS]
MKTRHLPALALTGALALGLLGCSDAAPGVDCQGPRAVCQPLEPIAELDGVLAVEGKYTVLNQDALDGDVAVLTVLITLGEVMDPGRAETTAQRAWATAAEVTAPGAALTVQVRAEAGATGPDGQARLSVGVGEDTPGRVQQAFALLQAGAQSVSGHSAQVPDAAAFERLAQLAQAQRFPVELRTGDGRLRYSSSNVPEMDGIELLLELAALDSVAKASLDNSGLAVVASGRGPSQAHADLERWLRKHEPLRNEELSFILFSPSYDILVEGWVGDKKPSYLIPEPVSLPEGVAPWPQDPRAPDCTDRDLAVAATPSDAALGSRFMQLNVQNISSQTCALEGLPAIRFLNAQGAPQKDITLEPMPHVLVERIAIPAGASAMSAMKWSAASTTLDPDVTTGLEVRIMEEGAYVGVPRMADGEPETLDILDGSKVSVSPWVQAMKGWGTPRPAE